MGDPCFLERLSGLSSSRRMSRFDDAMPKFQQRIESPISILCYIGFPIFRRASFFYSIFLLLCFLAFLFHTSRTGRRHDTSRSHHMFCIYGCCTVLILLSLFDMRAAAIEIHISGTGFFTFFIFWFGLLAGTGLRLDKRKDKGGVFCSIYSQLAWQGRT